MGGERVADRMNGWLFHQLCFKRAVPPVYDDERFRRRFFDYDIESTRRFFARFDFFLGLEGKTVLDVGCGRGATCVEAARRGAVRVVGVDMNLPSQARELVAADPHVAGRVELMQTDGTLTRLGSETFDVILSKDSFEHYAKPESFVHTLSAILKPGGLLAIGFGPLWRSPTGGHIEYMTPLPWAHLLFPEKVVMAERRRFRPEEKARSFREIRGGLNQMTLARFQAIMASSGLDRVYFRTNAGKHPVVRAMRLVSRITPLREYFTANVYGVWRRPGETGDRA